MYSRAPTALSMGYRIFGECISLRLSSDPQLTEHQQWDGDRIQLWVVRCSWWY